MNNQQIATIFEEIGDLLDIEGANRFRVLAYKKAAETIHGLGRELSDLKKNAPEEIDNLPGIGNDLKNKIEEMLTTKLCLYHQELLLKYGRGLLDILKIRGIGPKKVALFYQQLGIDNLQKLKLAAQNKQLSKLPRMGKKSELEILQALEENNQNSRRMLLSEALPLAEKVINFLKNLKCISQIDYAGSLRRRKETIGDLDILVSPKNIKDAPEIVATFQKFPLIKNIISNGPTKSSVILENGIQMDLRVVENKSFGAALHYFTGSKDHNVSIRDMAKKAHKKINEYGIFDLHKNASEQEEEIFIVGDTEENFYKAVGLTYIPPTLRENRGEFEASIDKNLPQLIELKDLHGDLNINSHYSLGENTLEEIIQAAINIKLDYIGISDLYHSTENPTKFNETQLKTQLSEINLLQKQYPQLKIYKGLKLSINLDGSLELPLSQLKNIDYLTITINHAFKLEEKQQTARILKALKHNQIKIFSAPTARILNERDPISINIEKIINLCVKTNIWLEINSQPNRLDLSDSQIKFAHDNGAKLIINSDLTSTNQFDHLKYGIWTAQRGWAKKTDIINTQKKPLP